MVCICIHSLVYSTSVYTVWFAHASEYTVLIVLLLTSLVSPTTPEYSLVWFPLLLIGLVSLTSHGLVYPTSHGLVCPTSEHLVCLLKKTVLTVSEKYRALENMVLTFRGSLWCLSLFIYNTYCPFGIFESYLSDPRKT